MKSVLTALLLLALAGCGGESDSSSTLRDGSATTGEQEVLCHAGDHVLVTVVVAAPGDRVYGEHTRLRYPASLQIPGHRDEPSVIDRVQFVLPIPNPSSGAPAEAFANGMTLVNDEDTDFDGVDDRLQTFMSSLTAFADGTFVDVTFDCVETVAWPSAELFACEVAGVADLGFNEVGALSSCSVGVAPPETPALVARDVRD